MYQFEGGMRSIPSTNLPARKEQVMRTHRENQRLIKHMTGVQSVVSKIRADTSHYMYASKSQVQLPPIHLSKSLLSHTHASA